MPDRLQERWHASLAGEAIPHSSLSVRHAVDRVSASRSALTRSLGHGRKSGWEQV